NCGQSGTCGNPSIIGLQRQAELVVIDSEEPIRPPHHGLRHDRLHLLRHDTHIGRHAAVVAEPIEPEAIVEPAEEPNVVLERNIGSAPTTTRPATTTGPTTTSRTWCTDIGAAGVPALRLRVGGAA